MRDTIPECVQGIPQEWGLKGSWSRNSHHEDRRVRKMAISGLIVASLLLGVLKGQASPGASRSRSPDFTRGCQGCPFRHDSATATEARGPAAKGLFHARGT